MIIRKILSLSFSTVLPKAVFFLALPIILMKVSPEEYAAYAAIVSISVIAIPLLAMGADNYAVNISEANLPEYTALVMRRMQAALMLLTVITVFTGHYTVSIALCMAASMVIVNIFTANVLRFYDGWKLILQVAAPLLLLEVWRVTAVFLPLPGNSLIIGHLSFSIIIIIFSIIASWFKEVDNYKIPKSYWSYAVSKTSSQFLNNVSIQALPLLVYNKFDAETSGILFASIALLTMPYSILGKKQTYLFNAEFLKNRASHKFFLMLNAFVFLLFLVALWAVPSSILPKEWSNFKAFLLPLGFYAGSIFLLNPYLQLPTISGRHRSLFIFPVLRILSISIAYGATEFLDLDINSFLWIVSIMILISSIFVSIDNMIKYAE